MSKEPRRRVSITKSQRQSAAGSDLIALCQTITEDGHLTEDELAALKQWVIDNDDVDLPAKDFLRQTIDSILADGKVTPEERQDLFEAIETILPPDIRELARSARKTAEKSARDQIRAERDAARAAAKEAKLRNVPLGKWDFMVAGARYENRPAVIAQYANPDDPAFLARDPENQYSRNAVEVGLKNGMQIGFVPEEDAVTMAPLFDSSHPHQAYIKKILTGGSNPIPVVVASIYSPDAECSGVVFQKDVPTKVIPSVSSPDWDSVYAALKEDRMRNVATSKRSGCAAALVALIFLVCAVVLVMGFYR